MTEAEKHIADARRRLQEVNSQGPPWGNVQKLRDAIESLVKAVEDLNRQMESNRRTNQ